MGLPPAYDNLFSRIGRKVSNRQTREPLTRRISDGRSSDAIRSAIFVRSASAGKVCIHDDNDVGTPAAYRSALWPTAKMLLHMPKTVFNMIVFPIVLVCVAAFSLTSVNFSTIFYILLGAFASVIVYLCTNAKNKTKNDNAKAATANVTADSDPADNDAQSDGTQETKNAVEIATETAVKETENADKESK